MEEHMTNDTENLILEHLRAMRADIGTLKTDTRDIKARLASIETYIATMHGDQARTVVSLDDLAERVERLEHRAGILET
jgi:phage shock protein A